MHILVLCDDRWHLATTPRAGLAPLTASGFDFDFVEDAAERSPGRLADYPVTLLTKANNVSASNHEPWMTPEVEDEFVEYVRQGNGLLVVHSGAVGYEATPVLRALIGGVFIRHPKQCPVAVEPRVGHPLTAGCAPFMLVDEHYCVTFEDAEADLFLTTSSEHGTKPAGWTRHEGAGRVCMLTPSHNLEVWQHPSYQRLVANALNWCAGRAD